MPANQGTTLNAVISQVIDAMNGPMPKLEGEITRHQRKYKLRHECPNR